MLRSLTLTLIIAGLSLCSLARAEVNEPSNKARYWNLWDSSVTGGNGLAGHGESVSLCGGSTCSAGDFAVFSLFNGMPAGTGFIDPFLRFQHNEPPGVPPLATEAAYNTDARPLQNDSTFVNQAKDLNQWNHSIQKSDLFVDENGFYTFLLDINEPGATKSTLRLDELQFFVGGTGDLNFYDPDEDSTSTIVEGTLAGATKVWDMDFEVNAGAGSACNGIQNNRYCAGLVLDSALSSSNGSGDFDLMVKIPAALFAAVEGEFIYLYNFAGDADKFGDDAEAGFEEWSFLAADDLSPPDSNGGAPEPASLLLAGTGMLGLLGLRRRRRGG